MEPSDNKNSPYVLKEKMDRVIKVRSIVLVPNPKKLVGYGLGLRFAFEGLDHGFQSYDV